MTLRAVLIVVLAYLRPNSCSLPKPNIVLFLVDDLGFGDVPCFGKHSLALSLLRRSALLL